MHTANFRALETSKTADLRKHSLSATFAVDLWSESIDDIRVSSDPERAEGTNPEDFTMWNHQEDSSIIRAPSSAKPEDSDASGSRSAEPDLAVLLPSPLGNLGLKARSEVIVSLKIVPTRSERRHYQKFDDLKRSEFIDETLGRLSEYFAGARRKLDLQFDLDATELEPFTRSVLEATCRIPYGETRTYQKLASSIGASDRYRLVRAALMSNPLPILIPCHRVVPRRSGPGSYIAGTRKKKWLLQMEKQRQTGS